MPPGRDRRQRFARFAQPGARLLRLLLLDQPQNLSESSLFDLLPTQRRAARQQFIQEHTQRINVAAGIDAQRAHLGLLGAHVFQRADHRAVLREQGPFRQLLLGRLGHAEVDYLGDRLAVVQCDHHVGRLDVAMDDSFLMSVLDCLADRDEQFQSLTWCEAVVVAVFGDRHAVDQFHHEVRPPMLRGACIKDPCNIDMVHHCQSLPLGLKTSDHLAAVHSRLDDLQGHLAFHGLGLLGHIDRAHAAFANLLQELVRADLCVWAFRSQRGRRRRHHVGGVALKKGSQFQSCVQQSLDPLSEIRITRAYFIEIGNAIIGRLFFQRRKEDRFDF